jgi:hypothetical protein
MEQFEAFEARACAQLRYRDRAILLYTKEVPASFNTRVFNHLSAEFAYAVLDGHLLSVYCRPLRIIHQPMK